MNQSEFKNGVLRTLLYYEIFQHPLSGRELYALAPSRIASYGEFLRHLERLVHDKDIRFDDGFYQLDRTATLLSHVRIEREKLATKRIIIARYASSLMKRFPFVRAVFLSGDLSKGVATPPSDIDYVIITEPGRLWICRFLLIMFKKIVLLNKRKYFCLNYFVASDWLTIDNHNYYTATEIAHLKPLQNGPLFLKYINANTWIKEFFPNLSVYDLTRVRQHSRGSAIQWLLELPLRGKWAGRLDHWLMEFMRRIWRRRYGEYDEQTRDRIFRCSTSESRAFVGDFAIKVDAVYQKKLAEFELD